MIKILFLLISLIFPVISYSWFCKIDESVLDNSYFIPSLAKTVSIGIVREEKSQLFFVSSKPWKSLKIPIITEGCLGIMGLVKNERYLFISEQSQEMLAGKSLDRTNGSLNTITLLSSTFIEEASSLNDIPKGFPNTFWGYCVGDRSCQKVEGSCGEKMSVNYRYAEEFKKYSKEKNKNKKCKVKDSIQFLPAKCVRNFCS